MLGNVPIKTAAWAYHISPAKFAAYMGIEPADLAAECGGMND